MQKRRSVWGWRLFLILMVLGVAYCAWALLRPLPAVKPAQATLPLTFGTPAPQLNWPSAGQAAASVLGSSTIETHGAQTPAPTASTAKVITALVVLQKHPLAAGQTGPIITMSPADVARYQAYVSQDGSILPVTAGEQLSEYQMLEAMMLPSANNIADSLAIWSYGSLQAYATAGQAFLAQHSFAHTHIGSDASGLNPSTTTTATDLVGIGKLAMANPVLAGIVSQNTAAGFPIVNNIKNVNFLLGNSGIVGIKTGNSDQAGGVFLGAAKTVVNGRPATVVTAVVGAPNLYAAVQSSLPLIQSAETNFAKIKALPKNDAVGTYTTPWGVSRSVALPDSVSVSAWCGESVQGRANLKPVKANAKDVSAGNLKIDPTSVSGAENIPLKLSGPLPPPSPVWRLLHPLP